MKTSLPLIAAAAAAFLAVPAIADEPEASPESVEQAKPEEEARAQAKAEVKEEKRICRRVKLDMSSRRGTKVCKTADEWREFNQRR